MSNPRQTQFAGHAELLYHRLYDQFSNLFIERDDCRDAEAEQTRKNILETIADHIKFAVENTPDLTEPKEK